MDSWLARAAAKHPDRVALETADGGVTWADLLSRSQDGARRLAIDGVQIGDRVPLEGGGRVEFASALHACLLRGAAAVPIDPRLTESERLARAVGGHTALGGSVATVMYTSGTTSVPKPVELTYGNWMANAVGSALALGLDPAERWLCVMPLAHVGGLSILIRSTIYATTVVVHDRFDVQAVVDELMNPARRITMVSLVPTMLARLLAAGLQRPPTMRWALLGGGPIAATLLERARDAGVPVAPTYGMTEACSQIATFGLPLHGVEYRLDGPDGEIFVRGEVVAPGALDETGWLRTGDLGRFEHGRLVIVGRKADTIVSGGENVAPAEVEAVLLEHPGVEDAGVFGRVDPEWGEAVVASVVLREGATATGGELRAFCADRLARFKVPKEVTFMQALPRTVSGKLIRRALPEHATD